MTRTEIQTRRAEAQTQILQAFAEEGVNATLNGYSVSHDFSSYDKEKLVIGSITVDLYDAEAQTYYVYGMKKKILARYQVTDNGDRGRIAIGTKEYYRSKKMREIVSSLSEAMEQVKKFTRKF